jgi:hypothetical protein
MYVELLKVHLVEGMSEDGGSVCGVYDFPCT